MKRIAICLSHYSLANSPSIINFVTFLARSNRVDFFMESVAHTEVPEIKQSNTIDDFYFDNSVSFGFLRTILRARTTQYDRHIAFDPYGFALGYRLFPESGFYYYSLELYLQKDHFGLDYPGWLQDLERRKIHNIKGLIIQSSEKEGLFRQDYELEDKIPTFLLPVTYRGQFSRQKNSYLRDILKIPKGQKIALHLGGISELHACIELAESMEKIQSWSLVFHGYPNHAYLAKFKKMLAAKCLSNVYIHDRQFDSLKQVEELVQSADLGIAWYEDISVGFRTAGMSSGKIPAYLKAGLPVIATKYPSTELALETPGCGLCVDHPDEIPNALSIIAANYESYSTAASNEFDRRYRFEIYEDGIQNFLELDG